MEEIYKQEMMKWYKLPEQERVKIYPNYSRPHMPTYPQWEKLFKNIIIEK
jgi:hypothetical protein